MIVYTLVETDYKSKKEAYEAIYNDLCRLEDVVEVYLIKTGMEMKGDFDFILKFESEDPIKIGNTVVNELRSLEGVVHTESFMVGPKLKV